MYVIVAVFAHIQDTYVSCQTVTSISVAEWCYLVKLAVIGYLVMNIAW